MRSPSPGWARATLLGLLLVLLVLPTPWAHGARSSSARSGGTALRTYSTSTVTYVSSVDHWPLSYSEILPAGYSTASTYPLAVELHGISISESTPMRGGYPTTVQPTTASAASAAGFILIVPNTRTGDGFYVDSPYTGPQAQDIQDAIATEKALRNIGAVYLFGFSMGGMGSLSIGLQHPTEFVGLGAVAVFSDIYELYEYQRAYNSTGLNSALLSVAGGQLPNASAFSAKVFNELSELRAHSEWTHGLRMYFASGGNDPTAPNNPNFWPYQQANSSILQTTCLVATDIAEPPNCTLPVAALHAADPTNYSYRYVYEPNGVHDYRLLNASDLFRYWSGQVPDGTYVGLFPIPTPVAPATPMVTIATVPSSCGTIDWAGTVLPNGYTVSMPPGSYAVNATPCPGYALSSLVGRAGVSYNTPTGTATVTSSGALVAYFQPSTSPPLVSVLVLAPNGCGYVLINGTSVLSGAAVQVPQGSNVAEAPTCPGARFVNWTWSGGLRVWDPGAATSGFTANATGGLVAEYQISPGSVAVTVHASPSVCGPVSVNGSAVADGTVLSLVPGDYPVVAPSCPGHSFGAWEFSGGVTGIGNGSVATLTVSAAGAVTATYAAPPPLARVAIGVDPSSCGPAIRIGEAYYENASTVSLAPGTYPLAAGSCAGFTFAAWSSSGAVSVTGSTVEVQGNGSLSVRFTPAGGTGGTVPTNGTPALSDSPYVWAAGGLVLGLVAGAVAVAALRRRPPSPAATP